MYSAWMPVQNSRILWNGSYGWMWAITGLLGTQPMSSARAMVLWTTEPSLHQQDSIFLCSPADLKLSVSCLCLRSAAVDRVHSHTWLLFFPDDSWFSICWARGTVKTSWSLHFSWTEFHSSQHVNARLSPSLWCWTEVPSWGSLLAVSHIQCSPESPLIYHTGDKQAAGMHVRRGRSVPRK